VSTPAEPLHYTLEPAHSFVHFEVLHFGTSTTRGRFGPVTGEVVLDRVRGTGLLDIKVATAGVDTGLGFFNARLREPDLLASDAFPEARFAATVFRFEGERLSEVTGDFTLRGHTRSLTLKAASFGCRHDVRRDAEVCGGDFHAELHRSTYGMLFGWPFIGNRVGLQVQVEGVRALR
jgi:polyisoprenoid-binding protein YceI